MNEVPVVTSPKVEQLKSYVQANRGQCKDCGMPIWWASTSTGKRIPMDFGSYMSEKTHRIVMGYSEGGVWDGSVEAWPADSQATHTVHLDTCDKRLVAERHSHGSVQGFSGGTTHSHAGGNEPHDHDHGSYAGPGANWSKS
jgi:hypothetical protein